MTKSSEPWKPPAWLEPAFIYIAFSVAIVAAIALIFWFLITFITPFYDYSRETQEISLTNGQTFQVKYPNLVLTGDTPVYITLILYGESNATDPAEFMVEIPAGLTVVEPTDQAQSKEVKLTARDLGSPIEPTQMKIRVVNSRLVNGFLFFIRQPVIIETSLMTDKERIEIGIEKISWSSLRSIVNNTINEKSALILLVTGFLSGAGTLVFQYTKTHRDRVREDRQKKEDEFRSLLNEDFLGAINLFLSLDSVAQAEDWGLYERLVRLSGWENKLPAFILDRLRKKDKFGAKYAAENIHKLCIIYDPDNAAGLDGKFKHLKSLDGFCELTLIDDPKKRLLTMENASSLLVAYKYWRDLKPLITDLIHEFTYLTTNLPVIDDVFTSDNDGLVLLRDSSLQKIIIQKIIDDHIANTENDGDAITAALNISHYLTLDINWRPLWPDQEQELSKRTLRWLSAHWYEVGSINENFSLGSEYAELDNKLRELVIQHPVFELMHGPFPSIVFGDEGMGKTAVALWLAEHYQVKARTDAEGSKVFPIYAPFESGVDINEWLVEKISCALINFTADNPRRFITASDSQKTAMGRLMLRHTQSVDALRLNFHSSPFNNNIADLEQVLEYIFTLNYVMPIAKLTKDETLDLLYMARPDIFDQIYFLWDIQSAIPREEVINKIREIEGLASLLARQNLFIKIFAPLPANNSLGNLFGFHHPLNDLTWNEPQLRQLIEARIKMFDVLWERGIEDPTGLVISSINRSPRHIIRFLIRLMDYVSEHLQEGEKLNEQIFSKIASTQYDGGGAFTQNRNQTTENYESAVFVSYAWGGESEHAVNQLEQAFAEHGISIVRDKKSLDYKDSIETFEQRIGRGECVVLVISDKYLRSEHCMYELLIVNENKDLRDRIFPIVLADAGIYMPIDRLHYIKYWDEKIEELNQGVKNVRVIMDVDGVLAVLKKYIRIRASFDYLTGLLSDMNALTPEIHSADGFSTIISAVEHSIMLTKNKKDG